MIGIAGGIEYFYFKSRRDDGWRIKGIEDFGSVQFLDVGSPIILAVIYRIDDGCAGLPSRSHRRAAGAVLGARQP